MLALELNAYETSALSQMASVTGSQSYGLDLETWKSSARMGNEMFQIRSQSGELKLAGDRKGNVLRGKSSNDLIYGGGGNDRIFGLGGNDQLYGDEGDDNLAGGSGNDKLMGGSGRNKLTGETGQDILVGSKEADQLWGGTGNDLLRGESGKDTLMGGADSDRFVLNVKWGMETLDRVAVIGDYTDGQDSLQLVGLTVDKLKISQGTGGQTGNTVIQDKTTGRFLAILKGIHLDSIAPIDPGTTPTPAPTPTPTPPVNSPTEAEIQSKAQTSVLSGDTTIYTGYNQVNSNNKDPWVASFTNGKLNWYRKDYEVTDDDNQGTHLLWNRSTNTLYAAFTATGTQGTPQEDFRRFTTNGWLKSYSDYSSGGGGGGKVAILAKIDPFDGDVLAASFLTALNGTKTNSISVQSLSFSGDNLMVQADSAFAPRRADRTAMTSNGTAKTSPNYTVVFAPDLGSVINATSTNYA